MLIYECQLEFHDSLFYETRTLGRLYETGRLLHNIALCYALGFAQTSFHHVDDVPRYADEFAEVNDKHIYVTPAAGINIQYTINTFKLGDETFGISAQTVQDRRNKNRISYGRAKEIAIGSDFRFMVLTEEALFFPRWIRMGLWLSKAQLTISARYEARQVREQRSETIRSVPLNPADLPESVTLEVFDLVSMRPTNLIENAEISAESWWTWQDSAGRAQYFPAGLLHIVS